MTEEITKPKDVSNREMAIRSSAIDMAIRSGCAHRYDAEARPFNDPDLLISSANKIEQYIRSGKVTEAFIDGHSNNPKNPDTQFKNKEKSGDGW